MIRLPGDILYLEGGGVVCTITDDRPGGEPRRHGDSPAEAKGYPPAAALGSSGYRHKPTTLVFETDPPGNTCLVGRPRKRMMQA